LGGGSEGFEGLRPVMPPIHLSTAFEFVSEGDAVRSDRGFPIKYGREESPTVRVLERLLARLEGFEDALAFSSGMAAIATLITHAAGRVRRVVTLLEGYSTSIQLLERLSKAMGFELVKAWPSAEAVVECLECREGVEELVFAEVMTNPTLKVLDVAELAEGVRGCSGVKVVLDNTFTTPILLRPSDYGAVASVQSLTKYVAGHNDVIGGGVEAGSGLIKELWDWRRVLGNAMHAFDAYLTYRGLKTLEVRFARQCRTAAQVAEFLEDHPRVEEVMYPGLRSSPYHGIASRVFRVRAYGGVVSFVVKGSAGDAAAVLRRFRLIKPSPSLGGVDSLASIPAFSAARYIPREVRLRLGIRDSLIRLSVGLEDPQEIIEDLDAALTGGQRLKP